MSFHFFSLCISSSYYITVLYFSLTSFLLYLLLFLPAGLLIEGPLSFLNFCLTLPFVLILLFHFYFMYIFSLFLLYL